MLNVRSNVKNKIRNYFFLNENGELYINELARLIGADPKNVYRILVQMEKEGLLKSRFKGKERYFSSHTRSPLYKSYKEIFTKTIGLDHVLREKLKTVKDLKEAYLFGSYAKGDFNSESDLDLLLVGEHKSLDAARALYGIQKVIGREINSVNMKPKELLQKKKKGDQFIKNVFNQKVIRII